MDIKQKIGFVRPMWWYAPFFGLILYGAIYAYINPATSTIAGRVTGELLVLVLIREVTQSVRNRWGEKFFTSKQYGVMTVAATILIPVGAVGSFSSLGYISLVQGYIYVKIFIIMLTALPVAIYNHIRGTGANEPTPS